MHTEDAGRELEKIVAALERAADHHTKRDESNAALHMSDKVMYAPLTTTLVAAHQSAMRVRDAVSHEGISE